MKTPITDATETKRIDPDVSVVYGTVPAHVARRLELDRAALMAIAERAAMLATHQDCDPDHHSLVVDALRAIFSANANFPES